MPATTRFVVLLAVTSCATTTTPPPTTVSTPTRPAAPTDPDAPPPAPDPTPAEAAARELANRIPADARTALDDLVGSWSCDQWLDGSGTKQLDITRTKPETPPHVIPYTWALSDGGKPYCSMSWSARPDGVSFERPETCRFIYKGWGDGVWNHDALNLTMLATEGIPYFPESEPPRMDGSLSIVRHGTTAFDLQVNGTTPTHCRRR